MSSLRIVGSLYLLSGCWCLLQPQLAASFLAFRFTDPAGLAEFIAVYGGLQLGLGVAMWWVPRESMQTLAALRYSTVVSAGLLAARAWAMLTVSVTPALLAMAVLEAVLVAVLFWAWRRQAAALSMG